MKRRNFSLAIILFAIVLVVSVLSGCSASTAKQVTISVDGNEIAIESTPGSTIAQILETAKITLNDGDIISIDPEQTVDTDLNVKILRKCCVSITVENGDNEAANQGKYTVVLYGGTVKDAIKSAGITLEDNQEVNYDLDSELEDNMEIVISSAAEDTNTDNASASNTNTGSNSGSATKPGKAPASNTTSSGASNNNEKTKSDSTASKDKDKKEQKSDSGSGKSVVSVETYEDCDGSGHGVKVYTYSDGSYEEVPF